MTYIIYACVISIGEKQTGKSVWKTTNHVAAFVEYETTSSWIQLFFKMPVVSLTEKESSHLPVNITANATNIFM